MAKRTRKATSAPTTQPTKQPTALERVDAEIADARARAKALEADEKDAAHRLDDRRWRAAKAAGERAWARLDALEVKRAAIMAGEMPGEEPAGGGLTKRELALAEVVMELLLRTEVFPLEDRVKALESRPALEDHGVWTEGKVYRPGNAVSHGGSLWLAQCETSARPDTKDSGFRLAVKKGRDGKDGR
ncbi:hypothetical protein [Phreatobacter sp.]|uniref:hypothetical protein n=1 Tax=Phreatobacter sp. TaxID=1966341 RepID=UPI003F709CDA